MEESIFSNSKNSDSFLARYQIGVNFIFDDLQIIEIQEFLVTIDKNKVFHNSDQSIFKPISENEKKEPNS